VAYHTALVKVFVHQWANVVPPTAVDNDNQYQPARVVDNDSHYQPETPTAVDNDYQYQQR